MTTKDLSALTGAVGGIQGAFVKVYSQMVGISVLHLLSVLSFAFFQAGSMAQSMTMMQVLPKWIVYT